MDTSQRIIIHQVSLLANGNVQVELTHGSKVFQKTVLSSANEQDQLIAATRATIDAVNEIIPTPIVTKVSEIQRIKFQELPEPVIVLLVGVRIKGEEKLFPGTARINNSAIKAVVRATLDAINRPIGLFL